jgi:putative ABC transport system ATP-binding protein
MDQTSGKDVLRLLRRPVDEFGQTVVMVTHDGVAASIARRVIFMADCVIASMRPAAKAAKLPILDVMATT